MQFVSQTTRGPVLGIDPGWRHLGLCVYSPQTKEVLELRSIDLFCGAHFSPCELYSKILACLKTYREKYDFSAVVIEGQPDVGSRSICRVEAAIAAFFADVAYVIPARTVKARLYNQKGENLIKGKYTENKKAAIAYVHELVESDVFEPSPALDFWASNPSPDAADALIMVVFFERHHLYLPPTSKFKVIQ